MMMVSLLDNILSYASGMGLLEFSGLIFGLLCVYFLIKENILTWICGIIYVLISFVVFWQARLYGDFLLHIFFLILNIYGWYTWIKGDPNSSGSDLNVSKLSMSAHLIVLCASIVGILIFAQLLRIGPSLLKGMAPASLPFWDSTTSVLSITGMWLTAKKKIGNWYYWFLVDVLATGIYYYKELYFYSLLYFIYIFLAIAGYLAWRKSLRSSHSNPSDNQLKYSTST